MQIDRDNYEVYFIDYLDGNLNPEQMKTFVEFLQNNPDLERELTGIDTVVLQKESYTFQRKETLYRDKFDEASAFEETAVARMEGDLTDEEAAGFDHYLSARPSRLKDFNRYRQTRLIADENLLYPHKKRLYRQTAGRTILLWSSRLAAVLLAAALFYKVINFQVTEPVIFENSTTVTEVPRPVQPPLSTSTTTAPAETSRIVPDQITGLTQPSGDTGSQTKTYTTFEKNRGDSKDQREPIHKQREIVLPERMVSLPANIPTAALNNSLAAVALRQVDITESTDNEWLLTDFVLEKTGLNNLSTQRIAQAGLGFLATISKEKFGYKTNTDGEITMLCYNSRLLGLAIPTQE